MKSQFKFLIIFSFSEIITKIICVSLNLNYLEEKCILNDFYSKSNIIITFNVTEGYFKEHDIKGPLFVINIYNREKNILIKSFETKKTYGKFSLNIEKTGHYKTCIIGKDTLTFGQQRFVIFDFNIESSLEVKQRVNESANFKDFEKVNNKMEFITDKIEQIENMQIMANAVENTFSKNQINTSNRLVQLSILQIIIIFAVGIFHVYYLKKMFKDKINMPF